MAKFLDDNGLLYLWSKIKSIFVEKEEGKGLSANDFTNALKTKLDGIAEGANKTTVDSALSSTSTNPVQNKVINTALGNKVDKVSGKGLSTNDYTTTEKNKLAGIEAGAEVNDIDTVKVNGTALTPDSSKAVNITVASGGTNGTISVNGSDVVVKGLGSAAYTASTAYDQAGAADAVLGSSTDSATANTVYGAKAAAKNAQDGVDALEDLVGTTSVAGQIKDAIEKLDSSIAAETNKAIASVTITDGKITGSTKVAIPTNNNQLTNGAGYQTESEVNAAIADAIKDITGIKFEIVTTLPTTGVNGTIYLLSHGGSGTNVYDEYIYVNNAWEKIGTTDIDLTGYWNNTNLTAITNSEIDTIIAS